MVLWGLGVSRRTAPTIRCHLQSFSRFGGTWDQKVHFSTFSGKLTFQSSRNGPQNPLFCPGSLQDTFIIYSSISHQHIFPKYFPKTNIENRKSENLKFQKTRLLTSAQYRGKYRGPIGVHCQGSRPKHHK